MHCLIEVGKRGFDQEMIVVIHKDIGMEIISISYPGYFEDIKKFFSICLLEKYFALKITP